MAIIGLGGALLLSLKAKSGGLQYEWEWVKALLDATLIAVLGVVTSTVIERFKDDLQRRRDESKLRFDVLTSLNRTYMKVKLIRRKFQETKTLMLADFDRFNEWQTEIGLSKIIGAAGNSATSTRQFPIRTQHTTGAKNEKNGDS